jgi:uncharacterized membrane protein HdeD (DUF308 family)
VLATALFAWPATTWTPGYFPALEVHVLAGWVVLVVGLPAVLSHLWSHQTRSWLPLSCLLLGLAATLPAVALFDKLPEDRIVDRIVRPLMSDNPDHRVQGGQQRTLVGIARCAVAFAPGATTKGDYRCFELGSSIAILALLGAAGLLAVLSFVPPANSKTPGRLSGNAAVLLVGWALGSGVLVTFARREHWLFGGHTLHSLAGVAALTIMGLHIANRYGGLRARFPAALVVPGAGLGLAAAAGLWWVSYEREHLRGYREAAAATPFQDLQHDDSPAQLTAMSQGRAEAVDPAWLPPSASCGTSGCHQHIYEQWAGSPHRFAADNRLYRAAVDHAVEELGVPTAVLCAGCHDPGRALTGEVGLAYAGGAPDAPSDGVSCVVCHAIRGTHGERPANGRNLYRFGPPYPGRGALRESAIRRDPRDHRQTHVHASALMTPEGCMGCHRVELGSEHGMPEKIVLQEIVLISERDVRSKTYCTNCHLPFDQEGRYGHRMAGIAVDLGRFALAASEADKARVSAHASVAADTAGLMRPRHMDDPRWTPSDPDGRAIRLDVTGTATVEGGATVLNLKVATSRGTVGHRFPAGPMDLNDLWLEVVVLDGGFGMLHHEGALDAALEVPPGVLRMGAEELGPDGLTISKHRI